MFSKSFLLATQILCNYPPVRQANKLLVCIEQNACVLLLSEERLKGWSWGCNSRYWLLANQFHLLGLNHGEKKHIAAQSVAGVVLPPSLSESWRCQTLGVAQKEVLLYTVQPIRRPRTRFFKALLIWYAFLPWSFPRFFPCGSNARLDGHFRTLVGGPMWPAPLPWMAQASLLSSALGS